MVKILHFLLIFGIFCFFSFTKSYADGKLPSYPLKEPMRYEWSFDGPFGIYDKSQLRRGFEVYRQVCATCHTLKYVTFRDLSALNYSDADIEDFAKNFQLQDGPNEQGEYFSRAAKIDDYIPSAFANTQMAALANNGVIPPDLSLMARARFVAPPFWRRVEDIVTGHTAYGADYIASLLQGYQNDSQHKDLPEGQWENPYFIAGTSLSMAPPLVDGQIAYKDGTPGTVEQYAQDIAAFLSWSADPHMEKRKQTGFCVLLFLLTCLPLIYALKKRIFARLS